MDWYKMHLEQLKAEDRDTWISFSAKDDEKPTYKIAKWHDAADRLISISTLPFGCPTSFGQLDLLLSAHALVQRRSRLSSVQRDKLLI